MTIDHRWIYAGVAIVAGFVVGAVLAGLSRRLLGNRKRRPALRAIANPTATFLFWLAAVTGVITAIGFTSPDSLSPIPADILAWLPRALVAAIELHHLPETHHPDGKLIALVAAADHIANHFQRFEEIADYDVGLNRGAHAIAKVGHAQLLKNENGIIETLFDEVLGDGGSDSSDHA